MPPLLGANASTSALERASHFWRTGAVAGGELQLCLNRCRRSRNGVCDDHSVCRDGMDCSDCGVREVVRPPRGGETRHRAVWRKWVAPASALDVCLCTLMTADRLAALHRLAGSWQHTLSVAYLADEFERDAAAGLDLLRLDGRPVPHADRVTLSVVEDRGYREPNRFPFNLLRNVAVAAYASRPRTAGPWHTAHSPGGPAQLVA